MNKQQFAERLSDECDVSKAEGARTLDAILDSITEGLSRGDEISFTGFGKFVAVEQKARDSANPRDRHTACLHGKTQQGLVASPKPALVPILSHLHLSARARGG